MIRYYKLFSLPVTFALVIGALLLLAPAALAAEVSVSDFAELQAAVNSADNGDVITVSQDIEFAYGETLNIPAGKNISITSAAGQNFTLTCNWANQRHISNSGELALYNITLDGGGSGGGIDNYGDLTLNEGAVVQNCKTTEAGPSTGMLNNLLAKGAAPGGALHSESSLALNERVAIQELLHQDPIMLGYGGGIYNEASLTLNNGAVVQNCKAGYGGGIATVAFSNTASPTLTLNEGALIQNCVAGMGGGVMLLLFDGFCSFEMHGGKISGNKAYYNNGDGYGDQSAGGGVCFFAFIFFGLLPNGSFNMYGGEISGNTAASGGGVCFVGTEENSFNMYGGEIFDNTSESGGGIYFMSDGKYWDWFEDYPFYISGGKIFGNTARKDGGGVCFYGQDTNAILFMKGGEISGNTAERGGGVFFLGGSEYGSFSMGGGKISGNTAECGGGVYSVGAGDYYYGSFGMGGGEISGNMAEYGGGVYLTSVTEWGLFGHNLCGMYGGEISANTADYGGGVYIDSCAFDMGAGKIFGNTAENGGGVYFVGGSDDSFNMDGGDISGNIAINNGGGIYIIGTATIGMDMGYWWHGAIAGNKAYNDGGGIFIEYVGLTELYVGRNIAFSHNSANQAYRRNPADDELYSENIQCANWTFPFIQGYNNYDIGYTNNDEIPDVSYAQAFPDANFRSHVLLMMNNININYTYYGGNRTDGSIISIWDLYALAAFAELYVNGMGISDMTGLEYFSGLEYLHCYNNQLTGLDVSSNSKLYRLDCSYNQLTTLDVSKNTELRQLSCVNNRLTTIDVSNNTNLWWFDCYDNYMESPDSVIGWKEVGLTINDPENLNSGTFRYYNQKTPVAEATLHVSSTSGRAWDTVSIPVSIENSPGVKMFQLALQYDNSQLEFIAQTSGPEFPQPALLRYGDPTQIAGDIYEVRVTYTGDLLIPFVVAGDVILCTFEFAVREGAASGQTPLMLNPDNSYVLTGANENVYPQILNGRITVSEFIIGDIDGDGAITLTDLSLLAQYFIGGFGIEERYPSIFKSGDLDGNGKLELSDLALLAELIINAVPAGAPARAAASAVEYGAAALASSADTAITVAPAVGKAGNRVAVPVSVVSSPGVKMFQLALQYDNSKLKFISQNSGSAFAQPAYLRAGDPLQIAGDIYEVRVTYTGDLLAPKIVYGDVILCTFEFEIREGAAAGLTPLTLWPANSYILNGSDESVYPPLENGEITILPGDIPQGFTLSGLLKSYNPNNPAILELQGENVTYSATITGEPGSGQREQKFTFSGVEPGVYTLVITKAAHTSFTVRNIVVEEKDVDLTADGRPEVQLMTMRCGDINGDGNINNSDLTILWQQANYNRSAEAADNKLCDLNGDGLINNIDLTILWLAYNYNRGAIIIE